MFKSREEMDSGKEKKEASCTLARCKNTFYSLMNL
jgi:hypothetical protein